MGYDIEFLPRFLKHMTELDPASQKAVRKAIGLLVENPRHPSLRTKRVQGTDSVYEASANMDIRLTWEYARDGVLLLRNCGHHDDALNQP